MAEEFTIREDATIFDRDITGAVSGADAAPAQDFNGYTIQERLPAAGGEADIYIVTKNRIQYILKLYRYGCDPNPVVIERMKDLSERYPAEIVRIYEYGRDAQTARCYEILEYARFSTLDEVVKKHQISISDVITEMHSALHAIHENGLLHLDLKPGNILVRELEPLDLIFSDFGISSLLGAEFSKKMTMVKGTPLYWSPEAFTGVVGRPSDYWAFGMILLELLLSEHPFRGVDMHVIMYTLATKGVEIPASVDSKYQPLLRGLLTRQPEKRWGYAEIQQFLEGVSVQDYYETGEHEGFNQPFSFRNEQVVSVQGLCAAFVGSPAAWKDARDMLKSGQIEAWLKTNGKHEIAAKILSIKTSYSYDIDAALVKCIYTFAAIDGFVMFGKLINRHNIYVLAAKVIRNEADRVEKKIIADLCGNILQQYVKIYLETASNPDADVKEFFELLDNVFARQRMSVFNLFRIAECMTYPERYILLDSSDSAVIGEFIKKHPGLLAKKAEYFRIKELFFLPAFIESGIEGNNPAHFVKALADFFRLASGKNFVKRESNEFKTYQSYLTQADTIDSYLIAYANMINGKDMNLIRKIPGLIEIVNGFGETYKERKPLLAYLKYLYEENAPWESDDSQIVKELLDAPKSRESMGTVAAVFSVLVLFPAFACMGAAWWAGYSPEMVKTIFGWVFLIGGIWAGAKIGGCIAFGACFVAAGICMTLFDNVFIGVVVPKMGGIGGFFVGLVLGLIPFAFFWFDTVGKYVDVYRKYKERIDLFAGESEKPEPPAENKKFSLPEKLNAGVIAADYEKDRRAAELKYAGIALTIYGIVKETGQIPGGIQITFDTENSIRIVCFFELTAAPEPGTMVYAEGICRGMQNDSAVIFDHCVIQKAVSASNTGDV